jgi:hypothetical protein
MGARGVLKIFSQTALFRKRINFGFARGMYHTANIALYAVLQLFDVFNNFQE